MFNVISSKRTGGRREDPHLEEGGGGQSGVDVEDGVLALLYATHLACDLLALGRGAVLHTHTHTDPVRERDTQHFLHWVQSVVQVDGCG